MGRRRTDQRGQAAVELLAVAPLLAVVVAVVATVAAGSHTWVRAESAARVGARAHALGAPVTEATSGLAPPTARVRVEGASPPDETRGGVRVVVSRGGAGPRFVGLPAVEGWSPVR